MKHRTAKQLVRIMRRINKEHSSSPDGERLRLACAEATKETGRRIRIDDLVEAVDTLDKKRQSSAKS